MVFTINGNRWTIKEYTNNRMLSMHEDECAEFLYGMCVYNHKEIQLTKEQCIDQKKNTLKHELTHCWLFENGYAFRDEYKSEEVCHISACSNNFINEIINKYFKRK